jgi:long-subunit acyl-CoA synthetase (AMP-forming)
MVNSTIIHPNQIRRALDVGERISRAVLVGSQGKKVLAVVIAANF